MNGAGNAIDLVRGTCSHTIPAADGTLWLKATLDKRHCVETVIRYSIDKIWQTFSCTKDDCSNCVGKSCSYFTLTVSTEGPVSDLFSILNCRYGDTVKLERSGGGDFSVHEIAIIGKEG